MTDCTSQYSRTRDGCRAVWRNAFWSLILLLAPLANGLYGQSQSATYSAGPIPTNSDSYSPACNGAATPLTVNIPAGSNVTSVDVTYQMTAQGGAWTTEQMSRIYYSEGAVGESGPQSGFYGCYDAGSGATGSCTSAAGTTTYTRTGLAIANGITATGALTFHLEAWRTWPAATGCNHTYQTIPVNSWTVTVNYISSEPCVGSPTPGNTTASTTSVCSDENITLGLQNSTPGSGVSYQWQVSTDGGVNWTNVGGNSPTYATTQTQTSSYQAIVTCDGGGSETSVPVEVTQNPASACYCVPFTEFGCTDGDLIAHVVLNTLDNNSGTGCPSGTLGYSDYTTSPDPLHTTSLQAAGNYTAQVTVGTWGEGVAAWIDYNDDGVFDNNTERIGYSIGQVPANSTASFPIILACDPPLGVHRMRVRAMYAMDGSLVTPCEDNFYGETEDYLVTITTADPCPQPSQLANTGTGTPGEMSLSWAIGCAETLWDVHVQESGGPAPGTPSHPGVGNPYVITGLLSDVVYEFYVRADCDVNGTSNWSGPKMFSLPPSNDDCTNTTGGNVGANGNLIFSGNSTGATNTGPGESEFPSGLVWESFTLTDCVQSLIVDYCGSEPPRISAYINMFEGCPYTSFFGPAQVLNDCANGGRRHIFGQMEPGTYYIPISEDPSIGTGPYTISIQPGDACPPPPPNDLCENAIPLSCGVPVIGNTTQASTAGAPTGTCGTSVDPAPGVWYTLSNVCGNITLTTCNAGTTYDSKLFVYTGFCGGFTCVTGNDDNCASFSGVASTVTFTADPAITYYVYVAGFSSSIGQFELLATCSGGPAEATATPVDDCPQYSINVDLTSTGGPSSVSVIYSVDGGAPVTVSNVTVPGTTIGPFASHENVSITIDNGVANCILDLGSYYSNCAIPVDCNATSALVLSHCYRTNDTRTFTFVSSDPGNTLVLKFLPSSPIAPGDGVTFFDGLPNVGAQIILPPADGELSALGNIMSTGTTLSFTIQEDGSGNCDDGAVLDDWTFQVRCAGCFEPEGDVQVTTDCSAFNFDLAVDLFGLGYSDVTNSPATSAGIELTVDGVVSTYPNLTEDTYFFNDFPLGTQIEVVLLHQDDGTCDNFLGTFTHNLPCAPLNDECANAASLAVNEPGTCPANSISGTTLNANSVDAEPPCGTGTIQDVWYSFNSGEFLSFSLTLTTGNASNVGFQLFSACGIPLSNCVGSGGGSFSGLTANADYLVRVFTRTNLGAAGTFDICLTGSLMPECLNTTPYVTNEAPSNGFIVTVGCIFAGEYTTLTNAVPGESYSVWSSNGSDYLTVRFGTFDGPTIIAGNGPLNFTVPAAGNFYVHVNTDLNCGTSNTCRDLNIQGGTPPPPPPNDSCDGTTGGSLGTNSTLSFSGNSFGATNTGPGEGDFPASGVAWESFTLTECVSSLAIEWCGSEPPRTDAYINLFIDCPWTSFIGASGWDWSCANGSLILNWGVLQPGTYYVAIMNNENANGPYAIDIVTGGACLPPPANDLCGGAIPVLCGESVIGSTSFATMTDNPGFCGTELNTAPGVWYTVEGTGDQITARTCGGAAWDTKIGVFSGPCGALGCMGGNDDNCGLQSSVTWFSTVGVTYYIYVTGFGSATGDFTLEVICGAVPCAVTPPACVDTESEAYANVIANDPFCCNSGWDSFCQNAYDSQNPSCVGPPPANDLCEDAIPVSCGSVTAGTTTGSTATGASGCFFEAGVWYTIVGDGQFFTASTCTGSNFDTMLGVNTGACGALSCLLSNDDFCGLQSSLTWESVIGETYYIYVTGFGGSTGDFELTISCSGEPPPCAVIPPACVDTQSAAYTNVITNDPWCCNTSWDTACQNAYDAQNSSCTGAPPPANDLCGDAIAITCGSSTPGTTIGSTATDASGCYFGPGVWYTVVGDGSTYIVSTCDGADYDTMIGVNTGSCGALNCFASNDDACGLLSTVTWATVIGETYYIYVTGFSDGTGNFTLTLDCVAGTPPNDLCEDAIAVTCGSVTSGNTIGSTTTGQPAGCGGYSGGQTAGGVWYTIVGNGDVITASTCGGASWDTQIGVFTGTCGNFTCVDGNDDACSSVQSSVTWQSVDGVTYYVYVTAFSTASGAFDLTITCVAEPPPCVAVPPPCVNTESSAYSTVIANDPFCCNNTWDGLCQDAYDQLSGSCYDECASAVGLLVNLPGECPANGTIGTTVDATQSGAEPSCDAGVHQDVWFTFNSGANTEVDLSFAQGTISISIIEIFAGTCDGLVEVDCIFSFDDVATTIAVTPNTVYFVRVSSHATFDTPGDFTICLSEVGAACVAVPPPCVDTESAAYSTVIANDPFCCNNTWDGLCQEAYDALSGSCYDECASAVVLGVNASIDCPTNGTIGTTIDATQSGAEPSCDPGAHQDVWFTFNSGAHTEIDLSFIQGSISISIVDIFEGTCAGLVEVDCFFSFSDLAQAITVTPNTDYFVRVSSHATLDTPGDFNICLSAPDFVTVNSRVFLDGPFNAGTGLMGDNLRANGYIPVGHPYNGAPWNYTGTETLDAGVTSITGNDAVVDWVLLELRDQTTPSTIVARRAALVQRDGDIVDTDGVSEVRFDEMPAGDYHLAVRQRNHLGIMAANTYALAQIPTDIDLTDPLEPTYGTNARKSSGAVMTMWGGNANPNTLVNYNGLNNDRQTILTLLGAATFLTPQTGYHVQDVTMNGIVNYNGLNNDRQFILTTLGAGTFLSPRLQQLP